jgi:hypothetical protein
LQSLDESAGGGRDFRLDHKSLTAFELAWHLASSHVRMLDEVADHKCDTAPRLEQEPNDIAELVACELPRSVFVF